MPVGFFAGLTPAETVGVSPPEPGRSVTARRPDDTVVTPVCDGTVVVTQNNGQVCFLKLYYGQRRVSLAVAEKLFPRQCDQARGLSRA